MVQPRKVKCGPGSGNANPPCSAAPSACRLEEGDEKPSAQERSAVTGSGFLLATFSRIPDPGLEQREKFLFQEQVSCPHWSYPRLLGAPLDSPSGRWEKAWARSRAIAEEVRGPPEAGLGV